MDVTKLEKMKVVDLRNELQARGLDTKGVKAILIERLRAYLEAGDGGGGGGGTPGTPSTPSRRSRRTRSMTRSPSPSPAKAAEPTLAPLQEEEAMSTPADEEEVDTIVTDTLQEEAAEDIGEEDFETQLEEAEEEPEEVEEEQDQDEATVADEPEQDEDNMEEEYKEAEALSEVQDENVEMNGSSKQQEAEELEAENGDDEMVSKKDVNEEEVKVEGQLPAQAELQQIAEEASKVGVETDNRLSRKRSHSRSHSKEKTNRSKSHSRSHSPSRSRSRSRTRSRSPKRRSGVGVSQDSPAKGSEEATNPEDEPTIEDKQFGLSWFDSDLSLRIDPVTFTSAKPMTHEIYSLVWSGVRTNYGVREGKVCFEVRLAEETQMSRTHHFRDEPEVRGFRVGFSMPDSSLLLGESANSFAYCESGRKALNSEFSDYAKPYKLDDVIGCYLDLDSTPCTIKYTINGEDLGVAFEFDKTILGESDALFPHIVTKGYEFHINFADNENLLVNAQRPKRMRRKQREETDKSEKTENKERKKLASINEENWEVVDEAKVDDEDKKSEKEAADDTKEDVEMKETVAEEAEKISEEKPEPKEGDAEEAQENTADADVKPEDEKVEKTTTNGEKSEENDRDPPPTKRQKNENDKTDTTSEDEYEEVLPEAREPSALLPGFELIALIPEENYVPGPQRPDSRKDCEVILLVGLPGAGKTEWTLKHIAEHPEKRYHVVGADTLIARMTIDGVSRKSVHKGRWDKVYESCLNSLSSLEEIATKRRRNFILDQTNAYASAQRRKMKGFGDFKRIAVVCIPNEDELKRRIADKTDKGNAFAIRDSTLNNLRANFTLPSLEFGWFDDIIYTDLSGDEAKEEVKKYNEKGKKALDANNTSRDKRNRRDHYQRDDRRRYDDRRRDFRNDNRWGNERRGMVGGSRWGAGPPGGAGGGGYRGGSGWRDDRGYGGGGGGGGGARGYDNRNRYNNPGQTNWVQNNRHNRYDDRYGRSGGGGGGGGGGMGSRSYDAYGSGGGGSRDYRDRNRTGGGSSGGGGGGARRDNYRSGGGNQRDFRPGHRDNRTEDSRGGYERSAVASKFNTNDAGYEQYNSAKAANDKAISQGGKWSSYGQHQHQHQPQQQQHQPHQHQQHAGGNWQQYQEDPATQQQQQYWGYGDMQGYTGQQQQQQQQWGGTDPNQQQEWMSWWQQGGSAHQQQQQHSVGQQANDPNHYWSQYSYPPPQSTQAATATGGSVNATKK